MLKTPQKQLLLGERKRAIMPSDYLGHLVRFYMKQRLKHELTHYNRFQAKEFWFIWNADLVNLVMYLSCSH